MKNFEKLLNTNGYPPNTMKTAKRRPSQHRTRYKEDSVFFNFPFFNDPTHWKIRKIFKEAELPVKLYNTNTSLRDKLKKKEAPPECEKSDCSMSATGLCFSRKCVYQLTCRGCKAFYIGSTIRELHTRVHEHLTSDKSSVYQHRQRCRETFKVDIITRSWDAKCLRFKEAIAIKEKAPTINSRSECDELSHFLF